VIAADSVADHSMTDRAALRRRLGRLGAPRARTAGPRSAAARLEFPAGSDISTPHGPAYRIERMYPADLSHGRSRLADVLGFEMDLAAELASAPTLRFASPEHLVFLDTETTGLAGGAGTLVFLVGVGVFVGGEFRLRQYFLRHPDEEPAMLHALQEDLERAGAFVTFNGRAFDIPLLEMRYGLGLRRTWPLNLCPQVDLLWPSRRLWRRSLPDCSLGTIESRVLRVERSQADVPGEEIPALYLDYLRTGRMDDMARVVYHNALDVLSLVTLLSHLLDLHRTPEVKRLSPPEALALARWHARAGRRETAEAAYQRALEAEEAELQVEVLRRLTEHFRRSGRAAEAVPSWQRWHAIAPRDPRPCVELAKFCEWQAGDLAQARSWAEAGLHSLADWPSGWRRDAVRTLIQHRLARLVRKAGAGNM